MRLMVCAGGTGGGVYPALAVLQALGDDADEVLWLGSEGGMEADLIARANIPFRSISAAGLHGISLLSLPGNLWRIFRGIIAASGVIKSFKPDVLFFTGGFVAIPAGIAGRNIPSLLYVPDIEPGRALKLITRFADQVAVSVKQSLQYFGEKEKVTVTGYPARSDSQQISREKALEQFELSTVMPTLLVFGGSKGALSINRALIKILPELLEKMQIIHISGEYSWNEVQAAQENLSAIHQLRYKAFPYLHERMSAALTAADLVVSRAGASILGEYPQYKLPAILVPYPHAWHYQKQNAEYLAEREAAIILHDEDLNEKLLESVTSLIEDSISLSAMKSALSKLDKPDAAKNISELIVELGGRRN